MMEKLNGVLLNRVEIKSRKVKRRDAKPGEPEHEKRWFWHLVCAQNGKIICAGQPRGYSRRENAVAGWESVESSVWRGVMMLCK